VSDTIRGVTMRLLLSFMAVAIVSGLVMWTARVGVFSRVDITKEAAFGGGQADGAITLFMTQGRLCETYFNEPFEVCVIIMYDLMAMTFSTHEAGKISATATFIVERAKAAGYEVSDMIAVVHNHFTPAGFTSADRATYAYLLKQGFRGSYGIWYTATKTFVPIAEK
jgi:hypothetical protein